MRLKIARRFQKNNCCLNFESFAISSSALADEKFSSANKDDSHWESSLGLVQILNLRIWNNRRVKLSFFVFFLHGRRKEEKAVDLFDEELDADFAEDEEPNTAALIVNLECVIEANHLSQFLHRHRFPKLDFFLFQFFHPFLFLNKRSSQNKRKRKNTKNIKRKLTRNSSYASWQEE